MGRAEVEKSGSWRGREIAMSNFVVDISSEEFDKSASQELIREWLRTNDEIKSTRFYILQSLLNSEVTVDNKLSLRINSKENNWKLEKLYLIAFNSNRTGLIGFAADVYLPVTTQRGAQKD